MGCVQTAEDRLLMGIPENQKKGEKVLEFALGQKAQLGVLVMLASDCDYLVNERV